MSLDKIKNILVTNLGCDAAAVKPEANVMDDLGADSLAVMQIVMEVEDEFGIQVPDEDAAKMVTVKDIMDYIESKK